ncbi:CD83 antigen [Terrapene carolina triunguis]|uniref:CD83 antigen n=1 Tax=Terrapene triunguis TaxID=2587831 RepID=UPI000CEFED6F|nr:CD83 antigen [Terrapene carolina triunguis]
MLSAYYTQLVILSNVWCFIRGTSVAIPEVAVTCTEEALLACEAPRDPQVTYEGVSWHKIVGNGEELAEMVQKNLENGVEYYYPKELNGSLQLSSDDTYSLRITNTTSHNSGTYGCILWAPAGKHNQSGTIILKVTGCTEQLDEKFKKYRAELLLLSCLGIFYLLLIFFTCTCLKKENMLPGYHKHRREQKHTLILVSAQEKKIIQCLGSNSTCKNGPNLSSGQADVV